MAEKSVGMAVFVAANTSMCGFGSDGAAWCPSFCVLACPLQL